ncbi:conserved hypothetical protein [uncultured Desulfobacterium sp.]|uniref:DUF2760 domain-containing protein n=1 Tax=uncultured Desulfobacterium sp. TaxID=201089 RepID=A0A445MX66_9BACT|nr:conserved hypothetical protein [uncultured Desulfobacterium sp.]
MEKKISNQLLLWTVVWFAVLGIIIAFLGHMEMAHHQGIIAKYFASSSEQPGSASNKEYIYWVTLTVLLAVIGLLQFLTMARTLKRTIAEAAVKARPGKKQRPAAVQPTGQDKMISAMEEQARSLHLLSLLQREGRLVDFLQEDLRPYDDSQIGAAVRSIQESCQKALNEFITLNAVMEQEEGEEVTIPPGFDVNAVRLTGNVTGSPPFKGILQHRGWRVSKFSMPSLSAKQDPNIIAPAEVEIG